MLNRIGLLVPPLRCEIDAGHFIIFWADFIVGFAADEDAAVGGEPDEQGGFVLDGMGFHDEFGGAAFEAEDGSIQLLVGHIDPGALDDRIPEDRDEQFIFYKPVFSLDGYNGPSVLAFGGMHIEKKAAVGMELKILTNTIADLFVISLPDPDEIFGGQAAGVPDCVLLGAKV